MATGTTRQLSDPYAPEAMEVLCQHAEVLTRGDEAQVQLCRDAAGPEVGDLMALAEAVAEALQPVPVEQYARDRMFRRACDLVQSAKYVADRQVGLFNDSAVMRRAALFGTAAVSLGGMALAYRRWRQAQPSA